MESGVPLDQVKAQANEFFERARARLNLEVPAALHDLTATLGRLNLNIGSAHIVTFGEKAVDSFYVTDLTGQKIVSPARQAAIRKELLRVFEPGAGALRMREPKAAARS